MWRAVWSAAKYYVGNDKDLAKAISHPAPCYHAPALTLLRHLDLSKFSVFDLDAYGSPWAEVQMIARRRRLRAGERVALVLTDGAPRRAMLGHTVHALAALAQVAPDAAGAHARWGELGGVGLANAAEMMGGRVARLRQAAGGLGGVGGRGMWYAWALLEAP
jgi:hypothetical protein